MFPGIGLNILKCQSAVIMLIYQCSVGYERVIAPNNDSRKYSWICGKFVDVEVHLVHLGGIGK